MVERMGRFPLKWKGRYVGPGTGAEDRWYGTSHQSTDLFGRFLDQHRPDISEVEKGLVLSNISLFFRMQPEDRVTASEGLEHEDFKALMRLHGL